MSPVLGDQLTETTTAEWPTWAESKAAGCTCQWFGGGAIAQFDEECPILNRHKQREPCVPDNPFSTSGGPVD